MRLGHVLLRLIFIGILLGAGWLYWSLYALSGGASPETLINVASQPTGFFPSNRVNILIVGKDYNHTNQGIAYSKNARSDTIMLMSLDLQTKTAGAVSVPRDTFVRATDGVSGKINATFARGGVELLKATLEQTFGVKLDYHLVFKDTAVKTVVDALGGVWVETIDFMKYDDNWGNLHIDLPAGRQFISGEQAVGFVRFREVNTYTIDRWGNRIYLKDVKHSKEEGDLRRTERQQQLLRSMAAQALMPQNLVRLEQIANVAFGQIETNLSRPQIMAMGVAMGRAGLSGFHSITLPGEGVIWGGAYYHNLNMGKSQALVDWLIKGDAAAGNRMVNVSVFNASGVPGVARAAATLLQQQGYTVASIQTADQTQAQTQLFYKTAALQNQVQAIQGLLRVPSIQKDPQYPSSADVVLLVGSDLAQAVLQRAAN